MALRNLTALSRCILGKVFAALRIKRNDANNQKSEQKSIEKNDRLTRYILDKSCYAPNKGRVKYNAFIPPKNNPEVSVFESTTLTEEDIWGIGDTHVASVRRRPIRARADIVYEVRARADIVYEEVIIKTKEELHAVRETTPHPLHCNIVGWPESKDEKISLAQELADASTLEIKAQAMGQSI